MEKVMAEKQIHAEFFTANNKMVDHSKNFVM